MDKKVRCFGSHSKMYSKYHDKEWGVPIYDDDTKLFEMLLLESAHAGLSWELILNKREGYRKAFDNFNYKKIAKYDTHKFEELCQDSGIVKNRLKIKYAITNAQIFIQIQKEFGSFSTYLWGFVNNTQVVNNWEFIDEVPSRSELSDMISKDLQKRGMKFVGSVIIYSYLQAVGVIDDHFQGCWKKRTLKT
ncbi:MAG: DNA-3-methyladenine glycosylase I [Nanoarchaeota archaeon]|nr:DNA-3-methyladenine glycosylase I [Nanoarchaeota archaeon]